MRGSTIPKPAPVPVAPFRRVGLFRGVADSGLSYLARFAHRVPADNGRALWPSSTRGRDVLLLLDGWGKLEATGLDGERVLLRILGPGDFVCSCLCEPDGLAPLSLFPVGTCDAVGWAEGSWMHAIEAFPRLATNFIASQSAYIRELQQRCLQMAGECVEARLARAVLHLARKAGKKTAKGIEIRPPLTREDLADLIGTTLHTVSRTLQEWEREGWVIAGRKRVVIVDDGPLRERVEERNGAD